MALPLLFLMELPDGLKGIAIVGVLADAMSSLDSVINSLSAVTMEDFVKRCGWVSMTSDRVEIVWSKWLTALWGVLAVVVWSFWVDDIVSTVLVAVNKPGSLINGPLLAIFVMAVVTQNVTGQGARIGFAVMIYQQSSAVAGCSRGFLAVVERQRVFSRSRYRGAHQLARSAVGCRFRRCLDAYVFRWSGRRALVGARLRHARSCGVRIFTGTGCLWRAVTLRRSGMKKGPEYPL